MSYLHSFTVGTQANRHQEPLTIDQIARLPQKTVSSCR